MSEYTLKHIVDIVNGELVGTGSFLISEISYDSRKLVLHQNSMFIAIPGERHNGHDYVEALYQKGIRNFLVSEYRDQFKNFFDASFVIVPDSLAAFQKLATYHRNQFSIPVIGITGSNGKTIVKEWIAHCLNLKKRVTRNPKSYNSQLGVPISVWNLDKLSEVGIFEAGISLPGEMEKLEKIIRPQVGILTNIGEAHQENFNSLEEKLIEKLKLFKNSEAVIYCLDQELVATTINNQDFLKNKKLITWSGKKKGAFCQVIPVRKDNYQCLLQVHSGQIRFEVTLPFIDNASIENASTVICYLVYSGYAAEEIIKCITSLSPVAMRLEQIRAVNRCTLINDTYNSDINSLQIAIDALSNLKHPTRSIILSDFLESGLPDEELYSQVADLIKKAKIREFFGIGKRIMNCKYLFSGVNAYFYENTADFLRRIYLNGFQNEAILVKGARSFEFEEIVTVLSEQIHTTKLEINLNNLVENLNYFRSLLRPDTRIMVMVKALSYGSGTTEIASVLQHEKVDYLGVAYADEGVTLRESGIALPILVMAPSPESYRKITDYNLEPEIYSLATLEKFEQFLKAQQIQNYPVHLKLETGMYRLGFLQEEVNELINRLRNSSLFKIQGIFSHLAASSDPDEDSFTRYQISLFDRISRDISRKLQIKPLRYLANSAAIERFPQAHFNMVRLGIGLHGISTKTTLKPVSTLKTRISQIKKVSAGTTVGYNRREIASKDEIIGIVPLGYADGLDRRLGNRCGEVWINGSYAKIIGDVCMDMIMIDLTEIDAKEDDEVIIFGQQNSIEKLANKINTIPYEILTNISSRVKRVYVNE